MATGDASRIVPTNGALTTLHERLVRARLRHHALVRAGGHVTTRCGCWVVLFHKIFFFGLRKVNLVTLLKEYVRFLNTALHAFTIAELRHVCPRCFVDDVYFAGRHSRRAPSLQS